MRKIINEQLPVSDVNPLHIRPFDYNYFTYPWHYHGEFEIVCIEEGEGTCLAGDSVAEYGGGTLFLFGSGLPHCMQSGAAHYRDECMRVRGVIIQFEKDFMQYSIEHYTQLAPIRRLLKEAGRGVCIAGAAEKGPAALISRLAALDGFAQLEAFLGILNAMALITEKTFIASPNYEPDTSLVQDKKMEKVLSYLHRRYTHAVSLEEVASFIAMNPTAFCRYFKAGTGKTLWQYLTEMRIGYACKLLQSASFSVSYVAAACGFESVAHFNRCFKRVTRQTPTDYRRRIWR